VHTYTIKKKVAGKTVSSFQKKIKKGEKKRFLEQKKQKMKK
jgi:hypothetical protein